MLPATKKATLTGGFFVFGNLSCFTYTFYIQSVVTSIISGSHMISKPGLLRIIILRIKVTLKDVNLGK
jgi:hypothetical protein